MPATERAPRDPAREWAASGLILLAIGCATAGLGVLLTDIAWWLVAMLVATIILLAAAVVRTLVRRRGWPLLASAVAAVVTLTAMFVPSTALLWIIPTFDSLGAFHELEQAGFSSIAEQDLPADAVAGIVYLICVGIAIIAVAMDAVVHVFRAPALAGVPLLVLLLVPTFVRPELSDAFIFALTAAAYLTILLVGARQGGRRLAVGLAAATIAAALIVPLALPTVTPGALPNEVGGTATGINPIITLGDDLRRSDARLALTYTTDSDEPVYLRLTVLDDFSGNAWSPASVEVKRANTVDLIPVPPGLGVDVPRSEVVTDVSVGDILTRWLPAPYAPSRIEGLVGDWAWEPAGLSVRTETSNARGQEYTVTSVQAAPSVEQLMAAGTTVDAGMERYLEIPSDLPPVVAQTALEVVGAAATNYEKAALLQAYFTGGDFTYSEEAPVEQGYDGSGAEVLAAFLQAKSGYCVHFSSAMASMARTLGIPARVAVGFTPGSLAGNGDDTEFRVTTHDFHAWPELYFSGIGWVRFEPTPGRGEQPRFAPLSQDDPTTPDVDESVPPPAPTAAATPAPTSSSTAAPTIPDDPSDPTATPGAAAAASVPWWALLVAGLLALVLSPAIVRTVRRRRRLAQVADGSASPGWDEVRDTADDLGLDTSPARTPRQLEHDLAPHLDDAGAGALARLVSAVESESFGRTPGSPAADDVRAVIASLRRRAPVGARLAARFVPRSLFAPWIAQFAPR